MPQWFQNGGYVMWPLLICSVTGMAIFLEKLYSLQRKKIMPKELQTSVEQLISQNKISEAVTLCENDPSALGAILHAGIKLHGKTRARIKEMIEEVGKREVLDLSKNIGALSTIAQIAPLLGLLGTVSGMIKSFSVINMQGIGNAQSLAGGISEALIATVTGLVVAIPTLVANKYLMARVKVFVMEIEGYALKITDMIAKD